MRDRALREVKRSRVIRRLSARFRRPKFYVANFTDGSKILNVFFFRLHTQGNVVQVGLGLLSVVGSCAALKDPLLSVDDFDSRLLSLHNCP